MAGDVLCAAALARDEMEAAGLADLTAAEIVVALRSLPAGPVRAQLEDWYWALAIDKHGLFLARRYREEYAWLRAH